MEFDESQGSLHKKAKLAAKNKNKGGDVNVK